MGFNSGFKGLNYIFGDQRIPEASSCKYLGINLSSHLIWADQVNYTTQKAWKAIEFIIRVLKHGNSNENLAYMSLVRPILEFGASYWDPYREGQMNALDRVQKKAAKFANQTKDSGLETLAQRRKITRICAMFKAYTGKRA